MNVDSLLQLPGLRHVIGPRDATFSDLTDDSRRVTPGSLFIARQTGDDRWRDFLAEAWERGAAGAVVPDEPGVPTMPEECVLLTAAQVDQALAGRIAAAFFSHPANQLQLVGITGTNGKTTVATLVQYLLNQANHKCGLLGTVTIDEGAASGARAAELTTPGAIELQRHFAAMVQNGCRACAMEVSSHALDQGRVAGLRFAAAVFTNLTQDHLDYHGSMEAYAAAKAKLFTMLQPGGVAVLNADDAYAAQMAAAAGGSHLCWTTQLEPRPHGCASGSVLAARQLELRATCSIVEWQNNRAFCVRLPVVGRHNVSNALQAVAAAEAVAPLPSDALVDALFRLPRVPGRLEPVTLDDRPGSAQPGVLVDYAHTPDALENVLTALRPLTPPPGKLIVVFGCGGDRDKTKRPRMAKLAATLADRAILTSDNPRTEDPRQILDDALAGVPPEVRQNVQVEIDRAAAIARAIATALPGDTVLIAGKGHEDYQIIFDADSPTKTRKIHFDDREHAATALRQWASSPNRE